MWVSLYYTSEPQQQTAISTNWCYLINFLMFFELELCLSTHETCCQAALNFSCSPVMWSLGSCLPDVLDGARGAGCVVDLLELQRLGLAQERDIQVAWDKREVRREVRQALKCYSPRMRAVVRQRCRDLAIMHETLEFSLLRPSKMSPLASHSMSQC